MADNSVDAVVTDPPYGLSFMGKKWDYDVPSVEVWAECLRVLKPGGHLLAFAGTRTQHRMAVRIEDAGFEIRDMIAWVYGSGFPKSHNISKAIDREAGERGAVGKRFVAAGGDLPSPKRNYEDPPIVLEAAKRWDGWGTALKPAMEPITMARKPLEGTVAENVLEHGTGAINVDGCRVELETDCRLLKGGTYGGNRGSDKGTSMFGTNTKGLGYQVPSANGRWPANLIHDGSDDVVRLFPQSNSSATPRNRSPRVDRTQWRNGGAEYSDTTEYGDTGSAARFFYCAKSSRSERNKGLEGFEVKRTGAMQATADGSMLTGSGNERTTARANVHPTVKPIALMRYLCRLVTPPGGTVLDPFTGSGTTGIAAKLEGFSFIGIEREAEYVAIAEARIEEAQRSLGLFA